jgi:hypothetical protein
VSEGSTWKVRAYAWIVRFKESNLDAFIFEVALALGEVQRGMIGGGVP